MNRRQFLTWFGVGFAANLLFSYEAVAKLVELV